MQHRSGGRAHEASPTRAHPGPSRSRAARRARKIRVRRRRRTFGAIAVLVIALIGFALWPRPAALTPRERRIVTAARSQLGYQTSPAHSYCNRFSAYWHAGVDDCAPGLSDEQWCADFAAWVWRRAGVPFTYGPASGELNGASFSFYTFGIDHRTWHPAGSGYVPEPGDVAVYGLDIASMTAQHVAVVMSYTPGARGPDVVNGDGSRTAFSVVETGTDQWKADIVDNGGVLAGYVAPPPSSASSGS